jgi:DNA-binding cell septation regulator SpoVG
MHLPAQGAPPRLRPLSHETSRRLSRRTWVFTLMRHGTRAWCDERIKGLCSVSIKDSLIKHGMRRMNGTTTAITQIPGKMADSDDLAWLFEGRPEARVAIEERLAQFPEYAAWLQGLASGVIGAVQHHAPTA